MSLPFRRLLPSLAICLLLAACGGPLSRAPDTVEGAWLGEGTFTGGVGQATVQAQLEILSDGTYRFLILKPAMLAIAGVVKGSWTLTGQTLLLEPGVQKVDDKEGGAFQQLRKGSKPRPMSITVADDLSALKFDDGTLAITFSPNPTATEKLQASGEVGGR